MERSPHHHTVCPMCNDPNQQRFVWSDMLHRPICWLCALELCIDFYPRPDRDGSYFRRAAELLGHDEWICRRLYLQEILMLRSGDSDVDTELCKRQITAINDYLAVLNQARTPDETRAALIILRHKLKDRAFRCNLEGFGVVDDAGASTP